MAAAGRRARADPATAGLMASAAALRWSRPDLTAALAEHIGEACAADGRVWVVATGWLVHARAAIGDGREHAASAVAELARRDPDLLDDPAADRLRIEVAALAVDQGEFAAARLLVGPVLQRRPADVRADALTVLARCDLHEHPGAVEEAVRQAEEAWGEVGGHTADVASAGLAWLSARALRRCGRPGPAADRAAEGVAALARIDRGAAAMPSRHLAAALVAEWLTASIGAGQAADARARCAPLARDLCAGRPTRHTALLRLTMARAEAAAPAAEAFDVLEQAAADASDCDSPDLESRCLFTLGTLREQLGHWDLAEDCLRRGVAARQRDRARSERFRAALRGMGLETRSAPVDDGDAAADDGAAPWPTIDSVTIDSMTNGAVRPVSRDAVPPSGGRDARDGSDGAAHGRGRDDPAPDRRGSGDGPPADAERDLAETTRTDAPTWSVVVDASACGARLGDHGALLREIDQRLGGLIPPGAHTRIAPDGAALCIAHAAWERSAVADWVYRALPGVFTAVADLDMTVSSEGVDLRAVVHGADGPVGAHLLHRIHGRRRIPGRVAAQAASPPHRAEDQPRRAGRRLDDEVFADHPAAAAADLPGEHRPVAGGRHRKEVGFPIQRSRSDGRHRAAGPDTGVPNGEVLARGAAEPTEAPQADGRGALEQRPATVAGDEGFSVEGWGLADLLAGALAAYRGL